MRRASPAFLAACALLAGLAGAGAAPRDVTDPEVGAFARRAVGIALSRGNGTEDDWRQGVAEVATPAAVGEIDAAWRLAGYDPASEARPRYLASPSLRADVRRVAQDRWVVSMMAAQSYAAKEVSGARGLQVEAEVVLVDPEAGRLAVSRIVAR